MKIKFETTIEVTEADLKADCLVVCGTDDYVTEAAKGYASLRIAAAKFETMLLNHGISEVVEFTSEIIK